MIINQIDRESISSRSLSFSLAKMYRWTSGALKIMSLVTSIWTSLHDGECEESIDHWVGFSLGTIILAGHLLTFYLEHKAWINSLPSLYFFQIKYVLLLVTSIRLPLKE